MVDETIQTLRGLGRSAFRTGSMPHMAVTAAARLLGRELNELERKAVLSGWAAERSEVSL